MTRNTVLIGLLIALGGCQSMKNLGEDVVDYIKTQRTPEETPPERYLADWRHRQKIKNSFDLTLKGNQDKFCRDLAMYNRVMRAEQVPPVIAASESGNATCQHVLGLLYETGNGVPKDIAKAQALYLQAAPHDPYAYVELGRMALDGVTGKADAIKARELFGKAGSAGAVNLGSMMEQGLGGPQDVQGALSLYIDATQRYEDSAWKAMRPLVARGVELNTAQMQKYNRLWIQGFVDQKRRQLSRSDAARMNHSGRNLTVHVVYVFEPEDITPAVYLDKSCGDPELDRAVVLVLRNLHMADRYLMPAGEELPVIKAPLVIPPTPIKTEPPKSG